MLVKLESKEQFESLTKSGVAFVDFYADWCGPCKMMMPIVHELAEEYENVPFIVVNTDIFGDIAEQYRVNSIPRFFIFKDGEIAKMKIGAMPKDTLRKELEDCLK